MTRTLALFDFDGTISRKDSLLDFLAYSFSTQKLISAMLRTSHYLLVYKLGLYPGGKTKEKLLSRFVVDMPVDEFEQLGQRYASVRLPQIIRPRALEKIKWHQSKGHRVVVVTASIDTWLRSWCDAVQVELLATKLAERSDSLTGKIDGVNCNGVVKVTRIEQYLALSDYKEIYAYGDSSGDKAMLKLADKAYYKHF